MGSEEAGLKIKYIFAGDSWALKGFTEQNYNKGNESPIPGDVRLADYWPWEYQYCLTPGRGNLACLQKFKQMNVDPDVPVIWVFTEPGRDYGLITGNPEFDWIAQEEIFEIRKELIKEIFSRIKKEVPNPIGFIGGLCDVDTTIAETHNFTVLYPSWQRWIAEQLNSQWFKFGWGASDIGWRMHCNNITPSKSATFAWGEQIKEWCWWEDNGYFCHEHPTLKANQEFADYLKPQVEKWLKQYEK